MASRSLGVLTLDLVARIGGYTQGLDKAEREAAKRAKAIEKVFSDAGTAIGASLAVGLTSLGAGLVAFDQLIKSASDFQDIAERIGGSGEGIASFAVAAGTAGVSLETIASASIRLSASLVEVNDESRAAGAAIKALGIDLETFKALKPEDQLDLVAKRMAQFEDNTNKTAVAVALFGKSGAQLLPFLKTLEEQGGRQVILTQQQIDLADEYADQQAKATAELKLYAQQASTQALPALTNLVKVFIDLGKEIIGVDKETGKLNSNNYIGEFAESAVTAAAFIVDAFRGVGQVVFRTGEFLGASAAVMVASIKGDFKALDAIGKAYRESLDDGFDSLRTRLTEQIELQRKLRASGGVASSGSGGGRSGLNYRGPSDRAKKEKQEIDEASRSLASYVQQLQRQIDKENELTEIQKAQQFLLSLGKTGEIDQVRELVLGLAERIDKEKALNEELEIQKQIVLEMGDEVNRQNEAYQNRLASLVDGTPSRVFEKQLSDLEFLTKALNEGAISATEYWQAFNQVLERGANKTKTLADELGLSFTSAFEDAIVGGKGLSDVLKGLEQDIIRIVTRKLVTEPLGNALGDFLNPITSGGGSGGGGILSGIGGFLRNLLPFDGGGFTGSGPRAGGLDGKGGFVAMLHPNETVVDHTKGQRMGGITINNSFAPGTDKRTIDQAALAIGQRIERAQRNA